MFNRTLNAPLLLLLPKLCATVFTKKEVICLFFDFVQGFNLFPMSKMLFLIFKISISIFVTKIYPPTYYFPFDTKREKN